MVLSIGHLYCKSSARTYVQDFDNIKLFLIDQLDKIQWGSSVLDQTGPQGRWNHLARLGYVPAIFANLSGLLCFLGF